MSAESRPSSREDGSKTQATSSGVDRVHEAATPARRHRISGGAGQRVLLALLLVILVWLPFQNGVVAILVANGLPAQAGSAILGLKEALIALAFLVALANSAGRRWRAADWLVLCTMAWVAFYVPAGNLPLGVRIAGARMIVTPLIMYFIGRWVCLQAGLWRSVWRYLVVAFSLVAVLGAVEHWVVTPERLASLQTAVLSAKGSVISDPSGLFWGLRGSAQDPGGLRLFRRMISTYMEPLVLGHAMVLPVVFLFALVSARQIPKAWGAWRTTGALLLVLGAQFFAFSRGAILASLAGIAIVILGERRTRLRLIASLAMSSTVMLSFGPVRESVSNTLHLEDPSSVGHVKALEAGLEVLASAPMGFGLGHGGYVGYLYSGGAAQGTGESFVFATTSQVGIVGGALFFLSLAAMLGRLFKAWRASPADLAGTTALAVMGSLVGYTISAVATESAYGLLSSGAAWALCGLVAGQPAARRAQRVSTPRRNRTGDAGGCRDRTVPRDRQ